MFNFEVLIGVDDLKNEAAMLQYRQTLDSGAQSYHRNSRYLREELWPYVMMVGHPGRPPVAQPENETSKQYRVLRRYYE